MQTDILFNDFSPHEPSLKASSSPMLRIETSRLTARSTLEKTYTAVSTTVALRKR